MKDGGDRIVALDFGVTCFLPPSFFAFVLHMGDTTLAQLVAKKVKYPESTEVDAMMTASFALVPFGTNEIGEQNSWFSSLLLASPPYNEFETNVLHRCCARAQVRGQVKTAVDQRPAVSRLTQSCSPFSLPTRAPL